MRYSGNRILGRPGVDENMMTAARRKETLLRHTGHIGDCSGSVRWLRDGGVVLGEALLDGFDALTMVGASL